MGVQQRQQICNLATTMHSTAGEVPAPRAGASTTLIGNTVYVFGGYLTNELRITNDMYAIDLETLVWRRIGGSLMQADTWHNQPYLRPSGSQQPQPQQQPQPRYFHSATAYGKYIVIYGGLTMASDKQQSQPKQQVVQSVLGEIALFDTVTSQWTLIASPKTTEQLLESVGHPPPNRFAHLATLVSDKLLLVMGGQDSSNEFLNDFSVYDLENKEWICSAPVGKQVGMYRSTLIASSHAQRSYSSLAMRNSDSSATDEKDDNGNGKGDADVNVNVDVNYSATTCAESWKSCSGPDVLMYTTNNFSNVRRSLYLLASDDNWNITDLSSTMTASSGPMPPGLRFPVAYVLGDSMIMAGSYFSSSVQGYVIWALDLRTNQWRFVDCFPATMATSGSATASVSESWNRAVLCPSSACLYVFGDPRNDIMEDYNIRQLNFSHVSRIALDAHGLVPPPAKITLETDTASLAAAVFEEQQFTDFTIV
ncbi:galactose oxidase, partial [Ramicandelaber brevisporus]